MADAITHYDRLPASIINKSTDANSYLYWKLFAEELNVVNTVITDLASINDISTQNGAVLDAIGTIVREKRNGKTDIEYRVYLTTAIVKSLSRGTIPELDGISEKIMGSLFIKIQEVWVDASQRKFDGTWLLDGTNMFDGLAENSGNVEIVISWFSPGDAVLTALVDSYNFVLENLHQIKGAGIHARVVKENH